MDGGSSKTAGVQFLDSIESLTTLSSEGTVDSLQVRGAAGGGGGGGRGGEVEAAVCPLSTHLNIL